MMNYMGYSNGYACSFENFHSFWGMGIMALIVVIVFIVLFKSRSSESSDISALKILDTKFASGDMSEEEYISKKRVLKNK